MPSQHNLKSPLLLLTFLPHILANPEPIYTPTATQPPNTPSYTECRDRCVPGGIISGTGCVSFPDFPFNGDWSVFGAETWSCICFQARTGGFSAVTGRGCGFGGCGYMLLDMYAEFNQNCTDAANRYNGTKPINSTTTTYPYPTTTIQPTTIQPTTILPTNPSTSVPIYLYTNSSLISVTLSTGNITTSLGTKSTVYHSNSLPTVYTTTQAGQGIGIVETGVVTVTPGLASKSTGTGTGNSRASTGVSPSVVVTGGGVRSSGNFLGALGMWFLGLVLG